MDCDEGAVSSSTSAAAAAAYASGVSAASFVPALPLVATAAPSSAVEETVLGSARVVDAQATAATAAASQKTRKSWKRKNAWGNKSYADLIYRAIDSSSEKRLTLAQIYDWLINNIDYFRQNSDSKSSIGWKVRSTF